MIPAKGGRMRKGLLLAATGLAVIAAVALLGARRSRADESSRACQCRKIRGTLRASVVTPAAGCASPVGLCTAGEFHGDGLPNRTSSVVAHGIAPAPRI